MPMLNVEITPETDKAFREAVNRKFGLRRGNIQRAVGEALNEWASKKEETLYHLEEGEVKQVE